MAARSSKKSKSSSPLLGVISTLGKTATNPVSQSLLRYLLPRVLPVIAPVVLGFMGFMPGCQTGKLPEITQTIRPGSTTTAANPAPATSAPTSTAAAPQKPVSGQPVGYNANTNTQPPNPNAHEISFGFWNGENFFDDKNDGRNGPADKEYDPWYASNPSILRLKLEKMTEAILSLNNGRGPDILAMCEIESIRAAQLLQGALNAKLADPNLHYRNVMMKEIGVGRHISPAILTRLAVDNNRTRSHGSRQRILEGRVYAGKSELIVIVGHWTSRLQDGSKSRMAYAEAIYGACNAIYKSNPQADIIICGDFNDNPTDDSVVKGLHVANTPQEALASKDMLRLFNLFGTWTPTSGTGTLYYSGWNQFENILVSPGMFDSQGWSCDPNSGRVANYLTQPNDKLRRPWRFGGEKDTGPRGYSDHFPVTARLSVRP